MLFTSSLQGVSLYSENEIKELKFSKNVANGDITKETSCACNLFVPRAQYKKLLNSDSSTLFNSKINAQINNETTLTFQL